MYYAYHSLSGIISSTGEVDCDEASSQSGGVNRAGAIAITFFVTLIITVVVSVLVVLVILFLYKKFCK